MDIYLYFHFRFFFYIHLYLYKRIILIFTDRVKSCCSCNTVNKESYDEYKIAKVIMYNFQV